MMQAQYSGRKRSSCGRFAVLTAIFLLLTVPTCLQAAVDLRVDRAVGGELDLSWTGGHPYFEVYRSVDPSTVVSLGNRIVETAVWQASDTPPAGTVFFYRIRERANCWQAVADSYVDSLTPDKNYGMEPLLSAGTVNDQQLAFFKFALSGIPIGAVVTSASLILQQADGSASAPIGVYDAAGSWLELGLTWNTKPGTGSLWDEQIQAAGSGTRSWVMTGLVDEWVNGVRPNDGLIVQVNGQAGFHYSSRENESEDQPRLCVTWNDAAQNDLDDLEQDSLTTPSARFVEGIVASTAATVEVGDPDPVIGSLNYLNSYRDLFRMAAPTDDLYLDRIFRWEGKTGVLFGRRVQNIPVWDESILVFHDGTEVLGSSSFLSENRWYRGVVDISPQAARDAAVANMSQTHSDGRTLGEPMLVWVPESVESDIMRRAWRVPYAGQPNGIGQDFLTVFVDAETSENLMVYDESMTADRPGENFRVLDAENSTNDFCWMLPWDLKPVWWDDNGALPAYPGPPTDLFSDGAFASLHSHDVYHYYFDTFGWGGMAGGGGSFSSYVHWNDLEFNNARYTPFCDIISFGDGWAADDVFGHEFTHGVIAKTSLLVYLFQQGALNESLSDFFGSQIDIDWDIGENRRDADAARIRNMADPTLHGQPDHMDAYCGLSDGCAFDEDSGGVHTNSGIMNKVLALLTSGGSHRGLAMVGMGRTKSEQLIFSVMVSRVMPWTMFLNMRDETVREAQRFRTAGTAGFVTQDVCDVINAFASVGLGDPDTDCDGTPDPPTADGDGDTIPDGLDNCPMDPNVRQRDQDADGIGDICDTDIDGDGFVNTGDNCPLVSNDQTDVDGDGIGDLCDDNDGDGILDIDDNCPFIFNRGQEDIDGDGAGDVCDGDRDDDGFNNAVDWCPNTASATNINSDVDSHGDDCDNCDFDANEDQADQDRDHIGDVCDTDRDGDGVTNGEDNCPDDPNPSQFGNDGDMIGMICDSDERAFFDGLSGAQELALFLRHGNIGFPIRIPIFPCTDGNCPNTLAEGFRTEITLTLKMGYQVRVVDDRGYVRAHPQQADPDVAFTIGFDADQEYFYQAGSFGPFKGRQYFLEMFAPPGSSDGQDLESSIIVESTP
jgi:hypothetical protein